MNIELKELNYKKYGKCLLFTNGYLELITTLELGPRIISFKRRNGENVLWEDLNEELIIDAPELEDIYYKGAKWNSYGGHRLWKAPEDYATYYPDSRPIKHEYKENTLYLIQEIQLETELQMIISISFLEENLIKVSSRIINVANHNQTVAPWSLSMCKGPGLEIVPLPNDVTDFRPQVFYSIWNFGAPYNDERAYFGKEYFSLRMVPGNPLAFKAGFNMNHGYLLYMTGKEALVKRFERKPNAVYPDNNVNFETYTKNLFLEIETLGELKELKPREYTDHYELWSLYELEDEIPSNNDEAKYKELIEKYCFKKS